MKFAYTWLLVLLALHIEYINGSRYYDKRDIWWPTNSMSEPNYHGSVMQLIGSLKNLLNRNDHTSYRRQKLPLLQWKKYGTSEFVNSMGIFNRYARTNLIKRDPSIYDGNPKEDRICKSVCEPCRQLLGLRYEQLCWNGCSAGGSEYIACFTVLSLTKKNP